MDCGVAVVGSGVAGLMAAIAAGPETVLFTDGPLGHREREGKATPAEEHTAGHEHAAGPPVQSSMTVAEPRPELERRQRHEQQARNEVQQPP